MSSVAWVFNTVKYVSPGAPSQILTPPRLVPDSPKPTCNISIIIGHINLYLSLRCYIRVVHGSDGPAGRVGSGRVGSGHDFAGFWRVGSGRVSTSDLLFFY